jgi:hypothetical protein
MVLVDKNLHPLEEEWQSWRAIIVTDWQTEKHRLLAKHFTDTPFRVSH